MMVEVVFRMKTPLAVSDPLHLDALLTAVHPDAVDATRLYALEAFGKKAPVLPLPLKKAETDGAWVWCSSAAFFSDAAVNFSDTYCRRLGVADAAWLKRNVLTIGGLFKDRVAKALGIVSPEVRFLAETSDMDALEALLAEISGLGKFRAFGYGETDGFSVEPSSRPWTDCLVQNGRAVRTIPVAMLKNRPESSVRALPPYWSLRDRCAGADPGDEAVLAEEVRLC